MDPYEHARYPHEPETPPDFPVQLRRNLSPPEATLWNELRARRLAGFKFRRQHPLGPYVADFYCHEARLVVEIDGSMHAERVEHDRRRDAWMSEQGLTVLRMPAWYVRDQLSNALRTITDAARRGVEKKERSQ